MTTRPAPTTTRNARNTGNAVRRYTVTVKYLGPAKRLPATRRPNTLYTTNADGSKAGRVFGPDKQIEIDGVPAIAV